MGKKGDKDRSGFWRAACESQRGGKNGIDFQCFWESWVGEFVFERFVVRKTIVIAAIRVFDGGRFCEYWMEQVRDRSHVALVFMGHTFLC